MAATRNHGRADNLRRERDRIRIAQAAARLIAEHGLTDWTLAKRKAARQLMLPEATALPSNEEIEVALADHHALFGGDAHLLALRRQRVEALGWMRRLARWEPYFDGAQSGAQVALVYSRHTQDNYAGADTHGMYLDAVPFGQS